MEILKFHQKRSKTYEYDRKILNITDYCPIQVILADLPSSMCFICFSARGSITLASISAHNWRKSTRYIMQSGHGV